MAVGYWYCATHNKYLPTTHPSLTPEGLYGLRYSACPSCPIGRIPNYRPLSDNMFPDSTTRTPVNPDVVPSTRAPNRVPPHTMGPHTHLVDWVDTPRHQ